MSAYLRSLNQLRDNVLAELRFLGEGCDGAACVVCDAVARLREHLEADVREVRADIEALIDGGQQW